MTEKKLAKIFEEVAQKILSIKTLEYRNCDSYDFYENYDGSISVGSIKEAFKYCYELGLKEGRKEALKK